MLTITDKVYSYQIYTSDAPITGLTAASSPVARLDSREKRQIQAFTPLAPNAAIPNCYRERCLNNDQSSFNGADGSWTYRMDGAGNVFLIFTAFEPRSYAANAWFITLVPEIPADEYISCINQVAPVFPVTPPISSKIFPGTFTVGDSFTSTLYGTRGVGFNSKPLEPLSYSFTVEAQETVTTPAGVFTGCYRCRIVEEIEAANPPRETLPVKEEIVGWYLPDTFGIHPVRSFTRRFTGTRDTSPVYRPCWPMRWWELTNVSSALVAS